MYINKLSLKNFRNYDSLDIEPCPNINIIVGNNAQGKTNIIEAIFFLSLGKSYRTNKNQDLLNWDNKEFISLIVEIIKSDRKVKIEIKNDYKKNKKILINGIQKNKVRDLLTNFNIVLFSPEDLTLIKGSPGERRSFIDNHISQLSPKYYYDLKQYEKVLFQKNNLLKNIRERKASEEFLDVWNEQLWDYGSKIIFKRIETLKKFSPLTKSIHKYITEGEELLNISYISSVNVANNFTFDDIKINFKKATTKLFREEIKRGVTLVGPQRDDLGFFINNKSLQKYGSQGQQRSSVLSFKLTEMELLHNEHGSYPVLLLDDVMSELDIKRRSYLLNFVKEKVQTFITATNLLSFDEQIIKNSKIFKIEKGKLNLRGEM